MKKLALLPASALFLLTSCSDPTVQDDLKMIKKDLEQLRSDHEELRNHYLKFLKDAAKAEVKREDSLEGSKMD